MDCSFSSSDGKFLSSLAEAIFSCVIEDARKNHLGGVRSLFQKGQLNCSLDSSVCIHRISEEEVVKKAKRCLEIVSLMKSSDEIHETKNGWWPPPHYECLMKIGGPELVLWANEYIPTYKLQINANTLESSNHEGLHELESNRWEVLLSHSQMVHCYSLLCSVKLISFL